jgi:cytochrome c-type biogenesis protein CcmE
MNNIHKRRIYYVIFLTIGLAIATSLILFSLRKNISVFLTPSQLSSAHLKQDYHFRLGGMVKKNSVVHEKNNLNVHFSVTDNKEEVFVTYTGVLPDLFREGTGVIAEGHLDQNGHFIATQVLAKHDENYMPKNVYKALRDGAH